MFFQKEEREKKRKKLELESRATNYCHHKTLLADELDEFSYVGHDEMR